MSNSSFGVLILTHGRPDKVHTIKSLRKQGYTGDIFLVVDNEDKTREDYIEKYGEGMVYIFDKKKYADAVDEGNNFDERRTITHARNASFDIAEKIGLRYFIQLDDDYTQFVYKSDSNKQYKESKIKDLDNIFKYLLDYYKSIPAATIAMAQNGDFIGGKQSRTFQQATLKRKCMNSFICDVERRFQFVGAMNEDVNTYTTLGSRGKLFLTVTLVSLIQMATQSQAGGITDMYLRFGTYAKAFTTVMMMPSCVRVAMMGDKHPRLHHNIKWRYCVPVILHEKHRKQ